MRSRLPLFEVETKNTSGLPSQRTKARVVHEPGMVRQDVRRSVAEPVRRIECRGLDDPGQHLRFAGASVEHSVTECLGNGQGAGPQ